MKIWGKLYEIKVECIILIEEKLYFKNLNELLTDNINCT